MTNVIREVTWYQRDLNLNQNSKHLVRWGYSSKISLVLLPNNFSTVLNFKKEVSYLDTHLILLETWSSEIGVVGNNSNF